uniref:Retrovirus-related Pol polyprotein from transposon TNT 1-94-like beta-barrel domain-containing protein n=1 Tax=Fagus sylvatica TaxID=28930 RepID=A0A2N9FSN7_FAGSY
MSTAPDMSKLEPFDGNYYKRWSERMLFYLESIHVDFVLFNDRVPDDVLEPTRSTSIRTYEKANRTCRGHILHYLSNSLFDIYCGYNSAKEIWDALKKKYSMEDAGFKKYVVGRFLDYKMVDEKPIMDQVHEYQHIVLEILAEGMKIDEAFQAAALIEKLPPSWKDYRNYLKHKKRELSMEDLVVHIRIEESNRLRDQIEHVNHDFIYKANMVEQKNQGKVGNVLNKGKGPNKRFRKGQDHHHPKPQANLTESEVIAAVVSKVNLVNNMTEWVVDTGATRHICSSKELFLNYEEATDGENVYLGDARTTRVAGKGKVFLKLTSGKSLALHFVLHVPDMRRNLVSGSLLNKAGIKLVFDADKLVLTRNGDFVGKGYCYGGLFVLDANFDGMNNIAFLSEDDPKTYQEAMKSIDASFWKDAINSELESIMANHTWELVDLPRGMQAYSRLSRYTHNPSHEHWTALTRLLRYLKGTMDLGLHFAGYPIVLEGYCDANWVSDNDETNSTSGYVFTLGGGAVSWKSSKQTCKARSTMESEFVALEMAGTEAEWLRTLLADIPLWTKPATSISLHCDSQAAIGRAKNKLYNGKQRHMRLRHNIV